MIRFIQTLCFLLIGLISVSQDFAPAMQRLAVLPRSNNADYHTVHQFLSVKDLPHEFEKSGQQFIKVGNHLYLCIDGTGRVYEIQKKDSSYSWLRVDSTKFYGYNFNSAFFAYKGSLYSFGGYGYWRNNGHLRKFNPKTGDWELMSLEEEVPFAYNRGTSLFYVDTLKGKLYISDHILRKDEIFKKNVLHKYDNKIACLDLTTRKWSSLGKRTDLIYGMNLPTCHGIFTGKQILDIEKNEIYEMSESLFQEMKSVLGKMDRTYGYIELIYCADSTVYIGNSKGFLDSFVLHKNDLILTNQKIYESDLKVFYIVPITLIVIILVGLSYFSRRKNIPSIVVKDEQQKEIESIEEQENIKTELLEKTTVESDGLETLDDREKELYLFILKKTSLSQMTTVEEINQLIGCTQRNLEVQKRMRSDLIISINKKLKEAWKTEGVIIDKKRAEFDKRSYVYFILRKT